MIKAFRDLNNIELAKDLLGLFLESFEAIHSILTDKPEKIKEKEVTEALQKAFDMRPELWEFRDKQEDYIRNVIIPKAVEEFIN